MDFFKKAIIGIIVGNILLVLIIMGMNGLDSFNTNKSLTVKEDIVITIDPRKIASYEPMLVAPYKSMDVYISNVEEPGFEFTSIGGYWKEVIPNGTNVEAEVKFQIDGKWTEWIPLEEEEEKETPTEDGSSFTKFAMAASNPATAYQYRYMMYGDGEHSPEISEIEWTAINAAKKVYFTPQPTPKYSSSPLVSDVTYIALQAGLSGVISREKWGADESYRYLGDNTIDPVLIEIDDSYYEQYKDELKYARVVKEDQDGDKYKWPLQYPEKVKKIIIHHTATTNNLDNPSQAIRDIYYYHAITRGWGDIGYNFIIDQDGKIYEGRYGGEGVIGAHAGVGNNGSIGIAVLGNFETEDVPEKVIVSLSEFISQKTKIHGIVPDGYSTFRGKNMPNIFGHKDIGSTQCPGAYLYEKLKIIRTLATQDFEQKKKFVIDYDFQDISDVYYLELKPGETKNVTIKLENIGKVDWNNETFIVVDQNPEFDGVINFPSSNIPVLAMMQENLVKPGEVATFKFDIKGGKKGKTVYMQITALANGIKKISDYKTLPVTVYQSDYKYKFLDGKYPEKGMQQGEEFIGWIKLENTGNVTWKKSGDGKIVLKADHELGRVSEFVSPASTTIAILKEDQVPPGETGTFILNLKAPQTAGYYQEYFTPVIDDELWMTDSGMNFETVVYSESLAGEVVSKTGLNQWERGEKYLIWIKMRNLGQTVWTPNNMKLVFLKEQDLMITEAELGNEKVQPGEIGTIRFVVNVDSNEDLETKAMMVRPKVNGIHLFNRPIYFYYKVIENNLLSQEDFWDQNNYNPNEDFESNSAAADEGQVRVKISYSGDPDITANGTFEVYNNEDLLTTLSAGQNAKVTIFNDEYKIETDNGTYTESGPIRFIPKNLAILEIENFNNQSSWNPEINYNRYRGVLEVRQDGGQLITINELDLEDYMSGLAEVPNDEEYEKIKAIIIAARTYAKYYMDIGEKFPGKPYHLDDDPNVCQKYLGYGYEILVPNVSKAVEETYGQVVTYNGEIVKTPYFSQSDGVKTKSALDVWNWDAPFLVSVDDSYCDSNEFWGHGVGMSGCGARGMAEAGYDYLEILKHYYTGVEITDLY